MIRAALIAMAVLVAILCTPNALRPEFNSADIICILAAVAVLVIGFWPQILAALTVPYIDPDDTAGYSDSDLAALLAALDAASSRQEDQ